MIGFALVGAGRIAVKHAEVLAHGHVAGARLVAVCDRNPERARALGARFGVTACTSLEEMIEREGGRIHVFCVLTPSGQHCADAIACARTGRHVVVEKPMALTLADADEMIAACESAGVRLFVVKQNRFNTPVQKLREALDEGRFGRLVMGTVRVRWCRRQDYYDQDAWRGTWRMDGGVFANQASHHVDLLQWLMGDVESVYAVGRRALADIEAEDVGIATLRFAGGAVGVIEATTATRPADLEGSVSVLGESGSVEIGGFAVNRMLHWRFTPERPEDALVMDEYRENPPNVYGFGHARYLQNVVDALVSGAPAAVDGVEGRRSLRLIAAIYASMERGREVRLDEADLGSRLGRG